MLYTIKKKDVDNVASIYNHIITWCAFHSENPALLDKRLTYDSEIETSSVNEVHNRSTKPASVKYFQRS